MATDPIDDRALSTAPRLAIAPAWTDPVTGGVYVHTDLGIAVEPWAVEQHIPPIRRAEEFGDVESWCTYIVRYGQPKCTLLKWNEQGLRAVLDYHGVDSVPNRCQWLAVHPFERSLAWQRWSRLAEGHAIGQRQLIEALEDAAEDIVEPDALTLVGLLRTLRATVSTAADAELRADGSTRATWTKQQTVQAGEASIPAEIAIAIPLLRGHLAPTGRDGKLTPVLYRLAVRIRVSVDDAAHLAFRLSMPGAERAFEAVFADRVAAAATLLGDNYTLLRGAGG